MPATVNSTRGDDYLIYKFGMLQEVALLAKAEISAIPETARADEEDEIIQFAIAPIDRFAQAVCLVPASTRAGAVMQKRAAAWLAGDGLDCLLEPMQVAA